MSVLPYLIAMVSRTTTCAICRWVIYACDGQARPLLLAAGQSPTKPIQVPS